MLRNALFSLLILIVGKSYAQQDYFVLIQADNSQPFYLKLGDKSLSSTIKGRLILSQLKGGSHRITIGFPKQLFPEQQFSFNIDDKDLEFQLKDLGEKGWGLFNPQTSELTMADRKEVTTNSHSEGIKKDDAFSRLMAGVVSDTAVMYNTYAMEEVLKADTTVTVSLPPASSPKDSTVTSPVPPATDSRTAGPTGTVVKLSERKTPNGLRLAFADRPKGRKADTIIVIIPMDSLPTSKIASNKPDSGPVSPSSGVELHRAKPESGSVASRPDSNRTTSTGEFFRPKPDPVPTASRNKVDGAVDLPGQTIVRKNSDTIHVYIGPSKKVIPGNTDTVRTSAGKLAHSKPDSSRNPSASTHIAPTSNREVFRSKPDSSRSKPDSSQKGAVSKPMVVNSDCRNFASDYDVDKLRVKMLETSKDDDKIQTARKIFKTKCFTTKQIKALSEVFTTDAGKYRLFEAAYPFVSDDHFRELTDLLADPVYNGKFRAMTGQQ